MHVADHSKEILSANPQFKISIFTYILDTPPLPFTKNILPGLANTSLTAAYSNSVRYGDDSIETQGAFTHTQGEAVLRIDASEGS